MKKELREPKEFYEKPEIFTEEIDIGVYGQYGQEPINQLQPFFGLCPPCN